MRVLVSFCCCDKHWPKATWGRKGFIWLTVVVQQGKLSQDLKAGSKAETKEEGAYWHNPLHLFLLLPHRNQDHHTWRSSTHSGLGLPTWTNKHENNQRFAHRPIGWRHSPVKVSFFQVTNSQELPSGPLVSSTTQHRPRADFNVAATENCRQFLPRWLHFCSHYTIPSSKSWRIHG